MIFIGADHAGYKLKEKLKRWLAEQGHKVTDVGARTLDKNDDYPIYAYKVAKAVARGKGKGILLCGSAEGVCIAANKVKGVRAVAVWTVQNAKLGRKHNDANVLCLSGWDLSPAQAKKIVKSWLKTAFTAKARHVRRLKEITRIERGQTPR
jgi:RpiB/LacA/LacB family sugar-phosphate isomerase